MAFYTLILLEKIAARPQGGKAFFIAKGGGAPRKSQFRNFAQVPDLISESLGSAAGIVCGACVLRACEPIARPVGR
jgi:hypothetical protein